MTEVTTLEIIPLQGVGSVRLGMQRAEVGTAMDMRPESFMKTQDDAHPTDAFFDAALQVFYRGSDPIVTEIEISRDARITALLFNIKVLELPAELALKEVARAISSVPATRDQGYTYEFSGLGIWFWRPVTEGDDAYYFETVGIGTVRDRTNP